MAIRPAPQWAGAKPAEESAHDDSNPGALLDAYREFRAKKMFWIVLLLNVVVIGSFSVVGVHDGQLSILWFKPLPANRFMPPCTCIKPSFSTVIVGFWFTWVATLLALVSTAGIFPDFLSSGSVDLFLARPISRLRLFFTKYLAGLLFVTLQVGVFTVLSFLVLGVRAGLWQPGLFIAIPLVVLFFSYLFGICAFLGVWTRSTMAARDAHAPGVGDHLGDDFSDRTFMSNDASQAVQMASLDDQIDAAQSALAKAIPAAGAETPAGPAADRSHFQHRHPPPRRPPKSSLPGCSTRSAIFRIGKQAEVPQAYTVAENISFGIKSIVPKTRETMDLLDRLLFSDQDLQEAAKAREQAAENPPNFRPAAKGSCMRQAEVALQVQQAQRQRSVGGSSARRCSLKR